MQKLVFAYYECGRFKTVMQTVIFTIRTVAHCNYSKLGEEDEKLTNKDPVNRVSFHANPVVLKTDL